MKLVIKDAKTELTFIDIREREYFLVRFDKTLNQPSNSGEWCLFMKRSNSYKHPGAVNLLDGTTWALSNDTKVRRVELLEVVVRETYPDERYG